MRLFSLLRVETGRLLRDRLTWLLSAVTILSPLIGLWLYHPIYSSSASSYATSLNGTYIGNPALAGAAAGAVAFALLSAVELDRVHRSGCAVLVDSILPPLTASLCRTLALMLSAVLTQTATLIVWLPFTALKTGTVFRLRLYASVYLDVMLPALFLSILFVAAIYQITQRFDLTLVLFTALFLLSMLIWQENWLLRWVNPAISYLFDDFGNIRLLRSVAWNRLFWLLLQGGIWLASFLCVRRYGKNLPGSFLCNLRKAWVPLLSVVCLGLGVTAYARQPFVDHSALLFDDSGYSSMEYSDDVQYDSIHVDARPNLSTGCHYGTETLKLHNISGQPRTVSFTLNPGYLVTSATASGAPVAFRDLADDDENAKTIEVDLPADPEMTLQLEFGGFPQEWNIVALYQGEKEISPDYLYLPNQTFAPCPKDFFWASQEPPPYTAAITLPPHMTPVVFSGSAQKLETQEDGMVRWKLSDTGHSLILYAGDYVAHQIEAAGITVEFLYSAKHQRVMEECGVDEVLRQVFEYCSAHYAPLRFYDGGQMQLIEIGTSGGGYASNGASVMGEDSFIEEGLRDPLKGSGGSEVLAHEIIHQWWGLGNMFEMPEPGNPWSAEGLTVYTTYRLMKQLHGGAYAQQNYIDVWRASTNDYYQNFYVRHPEFLEALPEQYQADIHNSLAQMRQYCEMPLKILKAEQLVGGEAQMDAILRQLFTREINPQYPYLTYQDFLTACGLTEEDLNLA